MLVLLRGLARSSSYWGELLDHLAPDFRLVVVDNRGVGRSDAPPPPYTTSLMADDVAAVLDHAGIVRAHLFGMSLGGMVAQAFALRHGARLDRLVLGCTTPGGRRAARYPLHAIARMILSGVLPPERGGPLIAPYLLSDATLAERPELLAEWAAISRRERPRRRGLIGQLSAAARHDAFDELPRIAAPTLVITGADDPLCAPANSHLLAARIPGAALTLLPATRHDFTSDQPTAAAAALRAFLLTG
jgi:3-oxoadipate enol-lactonase